MVAGSGHTLTLLFTDLVASTELASRLGDDAAHGLRRAHDRIVRDQVAAFGGDVVKNTGDGFFATFGSARQGVECGAAIQRAIARQQAEGRYGELSVRVGLHTGEPVLEEGDVFGIDVAIATRVMSEAAGGQVLISDITHLLARAHTPLRFERAGARSLKGVPNPIDVFIVEWRDDEPAGRRLSRFVGRADDRTRVRRRLDAALQGHGALTLIGGEPGVGKSRLASEIAFEARDRGMLVLNGRAFESEGLPPYNAIAAPLGRYLRTRSSDETNRLLGTEAPYIVKVLPELQAHVAAQPSAESLGPDAERYRLFEALTACMLRVAREAPLLLVIDDLHWADRATIHLLQHLMRRVAHAPVLLLATYRDLEIPTGHALGALIDELQRDGLGEQVVLAPLTREQVEALVGDMLGETPAPAATEALYAAAAGNPFFTEELVRLLRDQHSSFDVPQGAAQRLVPESVRNILLRRFERLGAETREMLTWCAVLGTDLTIERIAALTGADDDAVVRGVEEALDAHVLREERAVFAFAHPLIHEMLYSGLTSLRRQLMHRQVGAMLEELYAHDVDTHVQELAHHFLEAGRGSSPTAAAYARRAAEQASAVFAHDEAAAYYGRAADALAQEPSAPATVEQCELFMALGSAHIKAGSAPAADAALQQAVSAARDLGRSDLLARAALGLGDVRRTGGNIDQLLIDLLRDALSQIGKEDSALRAILMARLTSALYHVEPLEKLREMSAEALEMARRLDDARTIVQVLRGVNAYLRDPGASREKLADRDELIRLAEEIGDRETALLERYHKMGDLVELGEIAEADAMMQQVARDADELRQPFYQWLVAVYRAMRALFEGRYAEAEPLAQAAFALGREAQAESNLAFQFLAVQLFGIRWEQGRLSELLGVVQDFVRQYPALRWRVGLGFVYSELGDEAAARAEYEAVFAHDLIDIPDDFNQLIALTFLSDLCVRFNDAPRARLLYRRILPFEGLNAVIGAPAAAVGAASRYLGMLAGTMGECDDAERHFRDALAMNERMGTPPFAARTRLAWAQMLLRRRQREDEAEAQRLLSEADAIAAELDMARLRQEIAARQGRQVSAS
jgi:class 3 adenylate cyclase/tetratricopeptide (TPR) repeat protein